MPESLFNIFNKGDTLFSIILSSLTIKTCSTFFHPYFYSFLLFIQGNYLHTTLNNTVFVISLEEIYVFLFILL